MSSLIKLLPVVLGIIVNISCRSQRQEDLGSVMQNKSGSSDTARKFKFPPFDSYLIWKTGTGLENGPIFEYPANYSVFKVEAPEGMFPAGVNPPEPPINIAVEDQVFFGNSPESLERPTRKIDVSGPIKKKDDPNAEGTLKYPLVNGREYELAFTEISDSVMFQVEAMEYCAKKGYRLPLIRELFDFCVEDTKAKETDNSVKYEKNHCAKKGNHMWSASVPAWNKRFAFVFAYWGEVELESRGVDQFRVRCVKNP